MGWAAAASAAVKVVGGVVQARSAIQEGKAAEAAAKFNANMTRMRARQQEALLRKRTERNIGKMRTAVAASGVTMEGSPLDALAESAYNSEMDAMNIRMTADTESRLMEMRGSMAAKKARASATGILLNTASSVGSQFMGGGGGR